MRDNRGVIELDWDHETSVFALPQGGPEFRTVCRPAAIHLLSAIRYSCFPSRLGRSRRSQASPGAEVGHAGLYPVIRASIANSYDRFYLATGWRARLAMM